MSHLQINKENAGLSINLQEYVAGDGLLLTRVSLGSRFPQSKVLKDLSENPFDISNTTIVLN
jgi:hypothetical protein